MEVRELREEEFHMWDHFADSSKHGSIYNKSNWLKLISNLEKSEFKIVAVIEDSNIIAGIGFIKTKRLWGAIIRCPVLSPYNSLLVKEFDSKYESRNTFKKLRVIRNIINKINGYGFLSIEIKNSPSLKDIRAFKWDGWTTDIHYTYKIPLSDLESLHERVGYSVKRNIGKAKKLGIEFYTYIEQNKLDLIYTVLTSKEKNFPSTISKSTFEEIVKSLLNTDNCKIYFATLPNKKIIAVRIVLFSQHPIVHDWVAGTRTEYLNTGVSAFLMWNIIEDLAKKGFKYFDLNGANAENIAKFKSEFSGELQSYYSVKWVKPILRIPLLLAREIF